MNQLLYESRFLASAVGAMVRQDDLRVIHSRVDWERVCWLADSHRVAVLLYLASLGSWEPIPAKCKERLFGRYVESLCYNEVFEENAAEILAVIDMNQVACVVLDGEPAKDLYPTPEMGGIRPLRLYMPNDDYSRMKGFLVDLGYETKEFFKGSGERMSRAGGIQIELYYQFPFRVSWYKKAAGAILERSFVREPFEFVRQISDEDYLLLHLAEAAYHYASDALTLREMLELYLLHRKQRETLNVERLEKRLAEFRAESLAGQLLELAYGWFGKRDEGFVHALDNFDHEGMERRILTRGMQTKGHLVGQAKELAEAIELEIRRENKSEERRIRAEALGRRFSQFKKRMAWHFPGCSYMKSIYPVLEQAPFLLPFFWCVRGASHLLAHRFQRAEEREKEKGS